MQPPRGIRHQHFQSPHSLLPGRDGKRSDISWLNQGLTTAFKHDNTARIAESRTPPGCPWIGLPR
jgi:hypothetical protein